MPFPSVHGRVGVTRVVVLGAAVLLLAIGSTSAQAQGGGRRTSSVRPITTPSPADMLKRQVEENDPIAFLNDNRKKLALTNAQRDSFKVYQQELKDSREPLLKEVKEHLPRTNADRGSARGMPDTVRVLVSALETLNASFKARALGQLDEPQQQTAETLFADRKQAMPAERAGGGRTPMTARPGRPPR